MVSIQDAEANVRDAVVRGSIPGLRLFVATRVLASTGSVESRTEDSMGSHCLPLRADAIDGREEIRRPVTRRIAASVDVINFLADYRGRIMRSPPA